MASERRVETVTKAASSGDRRRALEATLAVLIDAIGEVSAPEVPPLAARMVDVLKELGGSDPAMLEWLRDQLARQVDAAAKVQGETDANGKPLGRELAPSVRQLTVVLKELAGFAQPEEADPLDEIAAARARRIEGGSAGAAAV